MIIKIPLKTPTVNNLYCPFYDKKRKITRMILKKTARELKKEIEHIVDNIPVDQKTQFNKQDKLKLDIEVHENWLTKKGTIFKKDVMNRTKFLIDAVFKNLPNIDDCQIYEHTVKKIQDENEFSIIKIEKIE